jgi:hypothetical protein
MKNVELEGSVSKIILKDKDGNVIKVIDKTKKNESN